MKSTSLSLAKLWVVATPIGNLGDFSPRAKEILSQVDVILAEDTRKAGKLCEFLAIKGLRFISLFEHNEDKRVPQVLEMLGQGLNLALISNAGTPVISDPGFKLVKACREAGYHVSIVPGPCAPIAALAVSGFPPVPFTFLGFLPRKPGAKRKIIDKYKSISGTLLFFERKSRILESLQISYQVLGKRQCCLARELTKQYEELIFFELGDWQELPQEFRGEFTVLIAPLESSDQNNTSKDELEEKIIQALEKDIPPKEIIKKIQGQVTGWSKKQIYEVYVSVKDREI